MPAGLASRLTCPSISQSSESSTPHLTQPAGEHGLALALLLALPSMYPPLDTLYRVTLLIPHLRMAPFRCSPKGLSRPARGHPVSDDRGDTFAPIVADIPGILTLSAVPR